MRDLRGRSNMTRSAAAWSPGPAGALGNGTRSEEHKSELQSRRDLHSFPTRRSSDLEAAQVIDAGLARPQQHDAVRRGLVAWPGGRLGKRNQIGRAQVRTPVTPRSTLFPYTTLFRSRSGAGNRCGTCAAAAT